MANLKTLKNQEGQALTEMLIVIPLLFLFAAGMIQFSALFLAKTSFEHACGQAARNFAAGNLDSSEFSKNIWDNLGRYQRFFDQGTLIVIQGQTSSLVSQDFLNNLDNTSRFGPYLSKIKSILLNYTGQKWNVVINYKSPPLFGLIFPTGIPLQTDLAVLKYPDQE
jgi:hypothetical protein